MRRFIYATVLMILLSAQSTFGVVAQGLSVFSEGVKAFHCERSAIPIEYLVIDERHGQPYLIGNRNEEITAIGITPNKKGYIFLQDLTPPVVFYLTKQEDRWVLHGSEEDGPLQALCNDVTDLAKQLGREAALVVVDNAERLANENGELLKENRELLQENYALLRKEKALEQRNEGLALANEKLSQANKDLKSKLINAEQLLKNSVEPSAEELLRPENFNLEKVSALIDRMSLTEQEKTTIKTALERAKDSPELLSAVLDRVRVLLNQ